MSGMYPGTLGIERFEKHCSNIITVKSEIWELQNLTISPENLCQLGGPRLVCRAADCG